MEALLQRLFIFAIQGIFNDIFNDDNIIVLANYPAFLRLRLHCPLRLFLSLRGGSETNFLKSSYKSKQDSVELLILLVLASYFHDYYLIWWTRRGVLLHRTRRERGHIFENFPHPPDDHVIINLLARHLEGFCGSGVLVAEMVSYHQRPHPSGHMFHPQSDVPQGLHLLQ